MFNKLKLDRNFIQNYSIEIPKKFFQNLSKISLILFFQIFPKISFIFFFQKYPLTLIYYWRKILRKLGERFEIQKNRNFYIQFGENL